MSFTNTSPLAFPTRGKQVALGTNPLTLAAPGNSEKDDFLLDMATTAVALGKVTLRGCVGSRCDWLVSSVTDRDGQEEGRGDSGGLGR